MLILEVSEGYYEAYFRWPIAPEAGTPPGPLEGPMRIWRSERALHASSNLKSVLEQPRPQE